MKRSAQWMACLVIWGLLVGWPSPPVFAQSALERLEEQVRAGENPATEAEEVSYLGAVADDDNEKLRGVRLLEIKPGGPAEKQGLKARDLVTAINGEPVATLDQFAERLGRIPIGEKATFSVERGDKKLSLPIQLGKRGAPAARPTANAPAATGPVASGPVLAQPTLTAPQRLPPPAAPAPQKAASENAPRTAPLGIRLAPVDEASRIAQAQPALRGGVITFVAVGSAAERAGLLVDDVIVAVDGAKIEMPDDAVRALGRVKAGQIVKLSTYHRGERIERKLTVLSASAKNNATSAPPLGPMRPPVTSAGPTPHPFSEGPIVEDTSARITEMERNLADLQKRLAALEETLRKFDRDAGITKPPEEAPVEETP